MNQTSITGFPALDIQSQFIMSEVQINEMRMWQDIKHDKRCPIVTGQMWVARFQVFLAPGIRSGLGKQDDWSGIAQKSPLNDLSIQSKTNAQNRSNKGHVGLCYPTKEVFQRWLLTGLLAVIVNLVLIGLSCIVRNAWETLLACFHSG